jgi:stress-induced morphogen
MVHSTFIEEKVFLQMITEEEFKSLIKASMPDAEVEVFDITGTMDHFRIWVSSTAFEGKNLIEQHQMVYKALDAAMKDGRIHAVEIKTEVPKN